MFGPRSYSREELEVAEQSMQRCSVFGSCGLGGGLTSAFSSLFDDLGSGDSWHDLSAADHDTFPGAGAPSLGDATGIGSGDSGLDDAHIADLLRTDANDPELYTLM